MAAQNVVEKVLSAFYGPLTRVTVYQRSNLGVALCTFVYLSTAVAILASRSAIRMPPVRYQNAAGARTRPYLTRTFMGSTLRVPKKEVTDVFGTYYLPRAASPPRGAPVTGTGYPIFAVESQSDDLEEVPVVDLTRTRSSRRYPRVSIPVSQRAPTPPHLKMTDYERALIAGPHPSTKPMWWLAERGWPGGGGALGRWAHFVVDSGIEIPAFQLPHYREGETECKIVYTPFPVGLPPPLPTRPSEGLPALQPQPYSSQALSGRVRRWRTPAGERRNYWVSSDRMYR